MLEALGVALRTDGTKGLFRGTIPLLSREVPFYVVGMTGYAYLKSVFNGGSSVASACMCIPAIAIYIYIYIYIYNYIYTDVYATPPCRSTSCMPHRRDSQAGVLPCAMTMLPS